MNWINNLFYMGLFTALTGSIAFAVYAVVAGVLDGLKKYRYIYGLLLVVLPFWLFPGLFLLLYVTHYRKMGEALFIKGHLFELTPVIAHIECVAAVVWLLGAATVLVLHLVRYYRVEHYIKKHRMPAEKRLQLVAAGTKERLKIRGNVEVYCCYGISSPMVLGLFHKWIVLPVRDFSPESLQIVLTHEFVHVRQHILTLKCVGRVLEDLFWYNPLIYIFNRRLDFWSEMACDMECCRDSENVFSVGQYFRAALELLTEETRPLEFPFSMFGAQNHLQERIRRMKQYRKQKEMKPLAVLASFILVFLGSICFTCGAGIGTQKAVQKIYAKTVQQKKVNVQMEVMDNQVCYATQIETDPDARHSYMVKEEPYDVYKQAVMDAFPEDITEDSIKLSAEIPKQTLCKWAVKGKPQKISITVDTIRADKTICVGILTSAHKQIYIEANGEVGQLFETSDKEFIRSVFIENTDVDTVKISGNATMLSDSEQNAGNTQR
jgi:beta-lactamase regulating signal transducer with metallopeptidase domain